MIFATDKGRMCNNILQYGHVYAWAREHGRKSISMRFSYKYQYFAICQKPWHNFCVYVIAKYLNKMGIITTVKFNDPSPEAIKQGEQQLLSHNTVMVKGWEVRFYDLFLKYKEEIVSLFAFNADILQRTLDYMSSKTNSKQDDSAIKTRNTISLGVHIRRGDYEKWHGGKYFFTDQEYALFIKTFIAMHPDREISVFLSTNDGNVTEEKYRQLCDHTAIYKFDKGPAEDLCMLSECDYIIGPPSTFSLVAAMYHDRPLHWMKSHDATSLMSNDTTPLSADTFEHFDTLFKEIL